MRRARFTYPGAVHLVCLNSRSKPAVFAEAADKSAFLEILGERARHLHIRLFAYCLLDDQGYLVLENSSGRMSDWLKQVNATFGMRYRRAHGGAGSIFHGRFHSVLIQDEASLRLAILHVLQSPARIKMRTSVALYRWSSLGGCLRPGAAPLIDAPFVTGLWGGIDALRSAVEGEPVIRLPSFQTTFGRILGEKKSAARALSRPERNVSAAAADFVLPQELYREFEARHCLRVGDLRFDTHASKRLRGELLLELKERAGLTYRQICTMPGFTDLRLSSLGKLYKDALRRRAGTGE